jgi:ABC-type phosphate transport system substrate-binding protein
MGQAGNLEAGRRLAAVVGAVAVAICAAGASMVTPASAESPPVASSGPGSCPPAPFVGISATPSAGLIDGQYVNATFCHMQPFEAMVFRQCDANFDPANLNSIDCTARNIRTFALTDSSGGGNTYVPVYAYGDDRLANAVGARDALGNVIKIPCDATHDCAVVAETNLGHLYAARISFAPSPADCPPLGPSGVLGSGSAAATRAMYRWSVSTCLPPQSLAIEYVTSNERSAYQDFFAGLTDFGITGLGPYPPTPPSQAPTYELAPMSASGVVLAYRAYNLVDGSQGSQITTLTLTPDMIAALFMGQINDMGRYPGVAALNPGIQFPHRTHVVARAENNSETYIFTSWLAAVAPNTWRPPSSPSPDIFPSTGVDLKFGEQATALNVVDPFAGFDYSVVYIGLMDSSTAAFYGLPTVRIAMPDGSTLSASSDSILRAISDSTPAPDGTLVPRWNNTADPTAWPMPMVTYMIAPTNTIAPDRAQTLAQFLRYAVQDGQTLQTDANGYAPLPANLVQRSLAVADDIPAITPAHVRAEVIRAFDSGAIQGQGIEAAALAKLDAAADARSQGDCTTAADVYQAFINSLEAQSDKKVDAALAAHLISEVEYLVAHCP